MPVVSSQLPEKSGADLPNGVAAESGEMEGRTSAQLDRKLEREIAGVVVLKVAFEMAEKLNAARRQRREPTRAYAKNVRLCAEIRPQPTQGTATESGEQ